MFTFWWLRLIKYLSSTCRGKAFSWPPWKNAKKDLIQSLHPCVWRVCSEPAPRCPCPQGALQPAEGTWVVPAAGLTEAVPAAAVCVCASWVLGASRGAPASEGGCGDCPPHTVLRERVAALGLTWKPGPIRKKGQGRRVRESKRQPNSPLSACHPRFTDDAEAPRRDVVRSAAQALCSRATLKGWSARHRSRVLPSKPSCLSMSD